MESNGNLNRELTCILFPGIVKNEEKAIECLGGIKSISQSYTSQGKQRLGLSFKPHNPLLTKVYGDVVSTAGVLLKVRVKNIKTKNGIKREVISTEVEGRVKSIIKFDSLMDFQYLPIHKKEPGGRYQCFQENMIPSGMDSFDFMAQQIPLHLVPLQFTKYDKPLQYSYADRKGNEKFDETLEDDVHQKIRAERVGPSNVFSFSLTEEYPTEPNPFYSNKVFSKRDRGGPSLVAEYEAIKKVFDERPICSSTYLRYKTGIKTTIMKSVLNSVAYYFSNGPWRVLWVRFGYDPRKDPESRKYQLLDFRVSHIVASSMSMDLRRLFNMENCSVDEFEKMTFFRPGRLPAQRQNFYQLCDVMIPAVQELIAAPPPAGYLCHERRGWLGPNTLDACRDHIYLEVKLTIAQSKAAARLEVKPTSSDEESAPEEDDLASQGDDTLNT